MPEMIFKQKIDYRQVVRQPGDRVEVEPQYVEVFGLLGWAELAESAAPPAPRGDSVSHGVPRSGEAKPPKSRGRLGSLLSA